MVEYFDEDSQVLHEELDELMDEIEEELSGALMSIGELSRYLEEHADVLRQVWRAHRQLLFIGFGMNEWDTDFTVSVEWQ